MIVTIKSVNDSIVSIQRGASKAVKFNKRDISKRYFASSGSASILIIEFAGYVKDSELRVPMSDLRIGNSSVAPVSESSADSLLDAIFLDAGQSATTTAGVNLTDDQVVAGVKTFSDALNVDGIFTVNDQIQQNHTDTAESPFHDGYLSSFDSNFDGYNVHLIRTGNGSGGALGAANTGGGTGSAVTGNRYAAGAGDGGTFVRIGTGAGHGVQATQDSSGAGNAIIGVKTGAGSGHGVIGVFSGTGAGHGVVGDVQTPTDGHGVYAVIEGGGGGDALRAYNVNGSGYSANLVGGKGARVQAEPVAFGPIKDIFTLSNAVAADDAYSLKMGVSFDGGGLSHFFRHFFGGNPYQQITFDHATHIRFGVGSSNTLSITSTGVIYHTTAEPPIPTTGDIVHWCDGTNVRWKKSDGSTGIVS